jgi:pyrroline-5-carboxylate reductase
MVLGIIGCGKMGSALVQGALRSKSISKKRVFGFDKIPAALEYFKQETGCSICQNLKELAGKCDTFLLATKPQDAAAVLTALAKSLAGKPALVISIVAGLTNATMQSLLPTTIRVVRTMPNTPCLVGKGASAFSPGSLALPADEELASRLLSSVGTSLKLPETLLDAVTGLSGSGPAYGFVILEALADGGVKNGLPRADALQLACQTLIGAAHMVLETGMHPGALKDMVASPGGTTIAGLAALEKNGLRHALIEAVTAASTRAIELSKL